MNIPEYVSFTLTRLEERGFSAYLVGGCVRDFIMGIQPHDFDITTKASPDEIEECFSDIKTLDIGKKHGTITLVFDKDNVEVTTYRIDGEYKDSRHPESVTFTDRIEDDLSRRDFTMNAIAYSPKRGFVDPFDGMGDIKKEIIRCVGEPEVRFEEDALRIMRALRFSSRLGFEIENETMAAIFEKKHLLSNIAYERINSELCGILEGEFVGNVILSFYDVFRQIVPEITSLDYETCSRASSYDRLTQLVSFFSHFDDARLLTDVMKRLKFDSKTIKSVCSIVPLFNVYFTKASDYDVKKAVSQIGVDDTAVLYRALYCHTRDSRHIDALIRLSELVGENACMNVKQLCVKGNEIIEKYNINPSMTGVILSKLLDDVISDRIHNEKDALLEQTKRYI